MRTDSIVPFAMEAVWVEANARELGIGDLSANGVASTVQATGYVETLGRGRLCDQVHDRLVIAAVPPANS